MVSALYEKDFYLWLTETAQLLRDGQLNQLDIPNLLEEIEAMGRSEKRAVYSNLKIVLLHLLKYKYQQDKRTNSWRASIREHRQRLLHDLADSPSLKPYLIEVFPKCYQDARSLAADEIEKPIETFPVESPFSIGETLDADFLP